MGERLCARGKREPLALEETEMRAVFLDSEGKVKEETKIESPFKKESYPGCLYYVIKATLSNRRQGTASTKRRGEVSGGGRKPWRQKGTGRARVGSIRSPLWRGGGVVFGPHPRSYKERVPAKMKARALWTALVQKEGVKVVDSIGLEAPKTKLLVQKLSKIEGEGSFLLVVEQMEQNLSLAARNIKRVKVVPASTLCAYDVLKYKNVLFTEEALKMIQERLKRHA
jgi:large subunit ribosomal protein L4